MQMRKLLLPDILSSIFIKMASQTGQDWQSNKTSVQERNAHMFNNEDMSDIQLACGETKTDVFYAHKYVLATSSPVFHRMFYGSLPETGPVIHLPDTDRESLKAFLRYLYTDETPGTAELALKVMYLAHKYMITALTKECISIVKPKVSPANAFSMIRYAMLVDEESLIDTAWKIVDSQTREVIKPENFCDLDGSLLSDFLKRDSLRITEVELFRAVLKWTESQCKKREMEVTEVNRRSVLGDAIYRLRFLAMSQDEFLQEVVPAKLLDSQDTLSILQKLLGHDSDTLRWPVTKKRSDYLRLARFDAKCVQFPSSTWRYLLALMWHKFYANPDSYFSWDYSRVRIDHLNFKVQNSEPMMFHGVRLFGDAYGSTYEVTMRFEKRVVSGTYKSELASHNGTSSYGFDVVLPNPVKICMGMGWGYDSDIWYAISLRIKGPRSCYGFAGGKTVKICEHNSLQLRDCAQKRCSNCNGTTISMGQIFQILVTPTSPCESCK